MEDRRKRAANFSFDEKYLLMDTVTNKFSKVEDKKKDRSSVSEKLKIWKKIEEEFNFCSKAGIFRGWQTLKRFYENRKKDIRKIKAQDVQIRLKTGGGPEVKTKLDIADKKLLFVMNEKTVVGIIHPFDCDSEDISTAIETDNTEINLHDRGSRLQLSIDPALRVVQPGYRNTSAFKTNNRNKNIIDRKRRRPTQTIKSLSNSTVAEKYDKLLDRLLILVEKQIQQLDEERSGKEVKRKLEIELLQLEIAAKKRSLP